MKLLIADDHDLVAHALSALLKAHDPDVKTDHVVDFQQVITFLTTGAAIDAILLDFKMPGMNGIDGVRRIVEKSSPVPVIVMSGNVTTRQIKRSIEYGAKGFVPKTLAGPALINAIKIVISGETYVPANVLDTGSGEANAAVCDALTPRELDVLDQLKLGCSNKEIAHSLEIAETTVKLHLRTISEKFSAKNRTDIIVRAFEVGLLN